MSLLLADFQVLHLSMHNDTDDLTELADSLDITVNASLVGLVEFPALEVVGEGLLLALVPILIEATFEIFSK